MGTDRYTDELAAEIERQDRKHGPFTGATALGRSRLAIACLEDEIAEVKDAWREERRSGVPARNGRPARRLRLVGEDG